MPKRSSQEKLKRYQEKIRKIEERSRRRRQRVIPHSDDDEPEETSLQDPPDQAYDTSVAMEEEQVTNETRGNFTDTTQPSAATTEPELSTSVDPELDPELLLALGESTSESPDFGENILESQAKLWLPLLKKGMPKEGKEKLIKEYPIPGNCKLLQAPVLNAEISAALPDMVKNRDKNCLCTQQQQLGCGITAINRAIDLLLLGNDKIQAIKHLSNSVRLLSDLHFVITQNRKKLITPSLDKTCLNVIQDTERDETIFGAKLGEKIKAAKAIERQGLQIKKAPAQKSSSGTSQQTARPGHQGNWQGPSRYPSNRGGGRGGSRRYPPSSAMTAVQRRNNPPSSHTKNAPQIKPRTQQ